MRLLLDQNLSFKLVALLSDIFPGSAQVGLLRMGQSTDIDIWHRAKLDGFVIVSLDADFAEMAALYGPPPHVVWLRRGNQPTATVAAILRGARDDIKALADTPDVSCLELYR